MTKLSDQQTQQLLKQCIRPISNAGLKQDLWPRMLRRFDEKTLVLSSLDLALLTVALVAMVLWPQSITGFFYQL